MLLSIPAKVFLIAPCFSASNLTFVINFEPVHVAPIVAAAPQFKAALDLFVRRLSHFRTAFKLDRGLVDAFNPWCLTKQFEPTVQYVNQRSEFNN
jgi:hypothetical protein